MENSNRSELLKFSAQDSDKIRVAISALTILDHLWKFQSLKLRFEVLISLIKPDIQSVICQNLTDEQTEILKIGKYENTSKHMANTIWAIWSSLYQNIKKNFWAAQLPLSYCYWIYKPPIIWFWIMLLSK